METVNIIKETCIERNVVLINGKRRIFITNTCNGIDRRKEASDIVCNK